VGYCYITVHIEHRAAQMLTYDLYVSDAEHLLAMKKVQWHDSVFCIAPKPHSRHAAVCPTLLSESDESDDYQAVRARTEEMSSDDCSFHTDDGLQTFYDAESDPLWLASGSKQDPSIVVEHVQVALKESPQHTGVRSSGASASSKTCSKDMDSVIVQEEEIVVNEPSDNQGNEALPVKAKQTKVSDVSLNDTKHTRESLTLPLLKLKLLKKLIQKNMISKQCKVKVDFECEEVILKGTADDVLNTKLAVYEELAKASECCLTISKELGCLLTSPRGQQWFVESCDQHSFVGLCYLDNSVTKLLAADDKTVDAIRIWLVGALVSERKSLEPCQLSLLHMHSWNDFVQKLMDSRLVLITVDDSKKEILIEGLIDMVKTTVKEVDDFLSRHCLVNKELPLKPADYRTLSFRSTDIVNKVQDLDVQQHR